MGSWKQSNRITVHILTHTHTNCQTLTLLTGISFQFNASKYSSITTDRKLKHSLLQLVTEHQVHLTSWRKLLWNAKKVTQYTVSCQEEKTTLC